MSELHLTPCELGFELYDGDRLVALYRANEDLPREESPKPCFHPIYTPSGTLVTEYRPKDHPWHTGLYYGWVHVHDANLWGGPWYLTETRRYEHLPGTHGAQVHESFVEMADGDGTPRVVETVAWRGRADAVLAAETRTIEFGKLPGQSGTLWRITSKIAPEVDELVMGASRAARYSGLELRMGPPFADAAHRTSEGVKGHEAIMGSRARWCCAAGASGGAVVMLDHPGNPRHPTCWFTRKNLLGAALLMEGDLTTRRGETLTLRYACLVLDEDPADDFIEAQYAAFAS